MRQQKLADQLNSVPMTPSSLTTVKLLYGASDIYLILHSNVNPLRISRFCCPFPNVSYMTEKQKSLWVAILKIWKHFCVSHFNCELKKNSTRNSDCVYTDIQEPERHATETKFSLNRNVKKIMHFYDFSFPYSVMKCTFNWKNRS